MSTRTVEEEWLSDFALRIGSLQIQKGLGQYGFNYLKVKNVDCTRSHSVPVQSLVHFIYDDRQDTDLPHPISPVLLKAEGKLDFNVKDSARSGYHRNGCNDNAPMCSRNSSARH